MTAPKAARRGDAVAADNTTRRNTDMSQPLPDLDVYAAATDPTAQKRYNELLIEQFRNNAGKVTGQFADLPVLLLKTIGAKARATVARHCGSPGRQASEREQIVDPPRTLSRR
jgi:hypothetical protein